MTNFTVFFEKNPLQDHCGIVAAFAPHNVRFFERGLRGLQIVQTRGYDGAGFCARSEQGVTVQHKGSGMVREVFPQDVTAKFASFAARSWVYQVRYGTSGAFSPDNVQPFVCTHDRSGERFFVVHNGQFSQRREDDANGVSDTYLFAQQIARTNEKTWDERILSVLATKRGAWSLVVATPEAMYIARDPWGFRPFVYGHVWDAETRQFLWVAASETGALDAMGATEYFELMPGVVAKVTSKGLSILARQKRETRSLCIFENIYLQHGSGRAHLPRTHIRALRRSPSIDDVRRRSGKVLAREAPLSRTDVDMVIGVPGTGIEGGMAYARSLDIPYFQAITDKAASLTEQRTFMTADIDSIYEKVLDHFCFDAQALAGRRVVLVDDSIVRGNITRGLVYLLKTHYKVPAVHLRIVSPPIDKSCHLGVNTRTSEELIAAQYGGDIEKIRVSLGATSLAYLSASGLKEALTGDPHARGFCMGCMAGHMPPIDGRGVQIHHPKTPVVPVAIGIPRHKEQFLYQDI